MWGGLPEPAEFLAYELVTEFSSPFLSPESILSTFDGSRSLPDGYLAIAALSDSVPLPTHCLPYYTDADHKCACDPSKDSPPHQSVGNFSHDLQIMRRDDWVKKKRQIDVHLWSAHAAAQIIVRQIASLKPDREYRLRWVTGLGFHSVHAERKLQPRMTALLRRLTGLEAVPKKKNQGTLRLKIPQLQGKELFPWASGDPDSDPVAEPDERAVARRPSGS
jgi:hypothetical protein